MSKETGGPAFPVPDSEYQIKDTGMTLRDHFAGLAMQGWLSSYGPDMPHPAISGSDIDVARNAYKLADAMIAARGE